MELQFVYLPTFERTMSGLLTDEGMQGVENELLINPRRGVVISHTGGARKVRVARPGRGKSGGARAIYLYVEMKGRIYFIAVYAKNVKENLSESEKKELRALVRTLEGET